MTDILVPTLGESVSTATVARWLKQAGDAVAADEPLVELETDSIAAPEQVRRVVLCTGKVFYDLLAARREMGIDDVALVRVEQLYPFPAITLSRVLSPYANAEVVWCQEEPENMGAWSFADRRIERVLSGIAELLLAIFLAYFFYRDGPAMARYAERLMEKLGGQRTRHLIELTGNVTRGVVYGLVLLLVILRLAPGGILLTFGSLPIAIKLCRHVLKYHNQPNNVSSCKFIAVALQFWSGLLLGCGFLI